MRRLAAFFLGSLVALLGSLVSGGVAAADTVEPLRPVNLRVFGDGEGSWHADNDFRLDWDRAPGTEQLPVGAVGLRVRDATGAVVVPEAHLSWEMTFIEHIHVPPTPGVYTADVWLESTDGERWPQASAPLRFDNVAPHPVRPLPRDGWVVGSAPVLVEIEHPAAPQPTSGISGYAVSVDQASNFPCAGPDRCTAAETDLRAGIDGDTISLGLLAEGIHVVRAVAVSGSGMRSKMAGSAILRVDATLPEVALGGVPQGWVNGPVRLTASATDALSGMTASGGDGPYTAISIDGGVPRVNPGASAEAIVTGEGSHRVAFYARDAAGNVGDGADGGNPPPVALVRIDESPPQVTFSRSQDPSDPERIEATVSDLLSGPDPARGSIAVRPAGSPQRFEPLATTASPGRLVARWDSESFPPGSYEFRATGYDAADNAATSGRRSDGARMVLANPLKTPTEIEAGFGGRRLVWQRCSRAEGRRRCRRDVIEQFASRPTTRAVPYGHGIPFAGRLTSISGSPLGGLPVRIVESFDPGADSPQRTTTVQTAADGTFVARLAPGPSRHVEALFLGNRVLTSTSDGEVRLGMLAGVRMRASATSAQVGGAPVLFSGRVGSLGAPIPAAGRPVELQFRIAGREWSEFRTVQTDSRGRFRYPYAFSDDDSLGVRFQFRAYVPAADGWPYEPATSRPVFVTGR